MAQVQPGDVVASRFRIEHQLGVGGMATVYAARELQTERRVAIKVLNEVLRRHPTIPKRFLQEAAAARALTTPFAVRMESTGELPDGTPYILMEYLDGMDLAAAARQAGGKLAVERALYLADQIAEALHDAHQHGVLHRDLKPENVFVVPTAVGEMIKVMDFGISKILAPGGGHEKITVTGTTVGTPQYMPIEQLRGTKDLDGRVDVYALGVLLYEMLAGLRPFDGFGYEEVIMKVATTTATPLSAYRSDLPPALVEVVMRAMARDRNARTVSMEQLRRELRPFWSGRRPDFGGVLPPESVPRSAGLTVPMEVPAMLAGPQPWETPPVPPAAAHSASAPGARQSGSSPPMQHNPFAVTASPASSSASGQLRQSGVHPPVGVSSAGIAAAHQSSAAAQLSYAQAAGASGQAPGARPAANKFPVALLVGLVLGAVLVLIAIFVAAGAWAFMMTAPTAPSLTSPPTQPAPAVKPR